MNYLEEYNRIINFRKLNPLPKDQYGENHHIVPKSICPILKNSRDNIVRLSAQEHFMAHYYLWKAYRDELKEKVWARKMCFAFSQMKRAMTKCNDIVIMSKLYEEVRTDFSKAVSETQKGCKRSEEFCKKLSAAKTGRKNPMYGRRPPNPYGMRGKHHTEETKKRISESQKGKFVSSDTRKKLSDARKGKSSWNKGIPMSEDTKAKLSASKKGQAKDMHWWNNGKICKRAKECPPGFIKGRLKRI